MTITVNGVEIPLHAIHTEMQHHPAPSREQAEHQAAVALVLRELMLQEAHRLGVEPRADTGADAEDALIAALVEREVALPEPDESACRRYYDANPARFRAPDLFEVAHILFVAKPEVPEERAAARAKAEATLTELRATPERFAELAALRSDCPSKVMGGNLGQLSQGQTVPEFEHALMRMADGELRAEPVETRFGFHVVRLHRRIIGDPRPYEDVREGVAQYLREAVRHTALRQYLQILVGRADIQGITLEGSPSPLVQ
ncbi:peptidyl-prolyl cis-trans isomerase C [Plasticicumulans lactativorans]|uniref:peptidylprolyl isomerase n=1 Tax=Plasticicumulans lactativorans TaxID=1133106 RepID=A0A4R2L392_9GAMM|nr:peptidylprolyl isomerase [Plasticicumulans lactativorans]TCO79697.1 peptidyl-prolyl cis-trans isomerase C [Plasticicumulans lactativorans]